MLANSDEDTYNEDDSVGNTGVTIHYQNHGVCAGVRGVDDSVDIVGGSEKKIQNKNHGHNCYWFCY